MSLKHYWQEFWKDFINGYREAKGKSDSVTINKHKEGESAFWLYFGPSIGVSIVWWIASMYIDKRLGQWMYNLPLTSIVFMLVVAIQTIWIQLKERSKKKKIHKIRSTFAILVDDQLLAESTDFNIITFQHAICQGLLLGVLSSSVSLAVLFTYYYVFLRGEVPQQVIFYIAGFVLLAVVTFLLLVESRLQAERKIRDSRYCQAATNYYLDRSEEIRLRNESS